jgi:hypothetical protein
MTTRPDLIKKWAPILEHEGLAPIKDKYRREVTAVLLENQAIANAEQARSTGLFEAAPANSGGTGIALGGAGAATGTVAGYDPILVSLVRRTAPQMIAYDVCGVQPMTQPTGLIFAMKSRYGAQNGQEALYNEADSEYSGYTDNLFDGDANTADVTSQRNGATDQYPGATGYNTGNAMPTAVKEAMPTFNEMSFSIEKTHVVAKTRALKAEYSNELAQDLQAVHGLDAESELINILSTEILAEQNREIIRTIYIAAKQGCQNGTTTQGIFDLDTDSNGRWSAEKFKGLLFQIEREANAIGQLTRRGRGNFLICSADVASALAMAGALDYAPALQAQANLNIDDTSTTYAGVLNSKMKVYIDPYSSNLSNDQYFVVGYKGPSNFDAGLFFCPYIPLQMVRAQDPNNFQPRIGFSTRYGMTANPFATSTVSTGDSGLQRNSNFYYRSCRVQNLS